MLRVRLVWAAIKEDGINGFRDQGHEAVPITCSRSIIGLCDLKLRSNEAQRRSRRYVLATTPLAVRYGWLSLLRSRGRGGYGVRRFLCRRILCVQQGYRRGEVEL